MSEPRPTAAESIRAAAAALADKKEEVNKLNVFPVPDGDTGTNMSLTMDAVVTALDNLPAVPAPAEVCQAVTHGSLMGARGNSGVILSQVLRGLCEIAASAAILGPATVAEALERAETVAYQAVRKPVEGTMLTVVRDTAHAARAAVDAGADLGSVLDRVVAEAFASVERGPELLPVLKENGVVDSGGYGLAILAQGFAARLAGHELGPVLATRAPAVALRVIPEDDWEDQEHLYCTEFLLFGNHLNHDEMLDYVSSQGGSELVVGDETALKIHVHTDHPDQVLAHALTLGEVAEVHVNNMRRQTAERNAHLAGEAERGPRKAIGFVAVAAGQGLSDILRSLGVDEVVSGGQTMNPSTADLLDAAARVNAETVFILPDNRNIILTAQQVAAVSDRPVRVVPTVSVPQAFSAMLAFDPEADIDENIAAMTDAASLVRTGEITTAIRDATGKAGRIEAGQVIGIVDHEVEFAGSDVAEVARQLVDRIAPGGETLTLLGGADLDEAQLERLRDELAAAHPELEVEAHCGGQPVYTLIVSVE